jgi:hypothetical protein
MIEAMKRILADLAVPADQIRFEELRGCGGVRQRARGGRGTAVEVPTPVEPAAAGRWRFPDCTSW